MIYHSLNGSLLSFEILSEQLQKMQGLKSNYPEFPNS